jgi:RNA polymerase sigma factor (sigma-70 family)
MKRSAPFPSVQHDELTAEMGWVSGLARRLLVDAARADDAAQEALTLALTRGSRGPRRGPALRAFLATATRIVARDQRRSERRRTQRERLVARPEATPSTLDAVTRRARAGELARAVEELDEPYRSAVRLRYLEQLSVGEVALRTGVNPAAVRKRVSRGVAMLRARFERAWDGGRENWAMGLVPLVGRAGWPSGLSAPARALALAAGLVGVGLVGLERMAPADFAATQPVEPAVALVAQVGVDSVLQTTSSETGAAPTRAPRVAPRSAPAIKLPSDQNAALMAVAFKALHAVGRVGEEVCARAVAQEPLDCASCHVEPLDPGRDSLPEGWTVLRYGDGAPRAEGPIVASERHGAWTEFHSAGGIAAQGAYFNGDRHGWWTEWHPGGKEKVAEGEYLYGRREGLWIEYDPAGARRRSATWCRGERHGLERTWHPGGVQLASETNWHAGRRDGEARTWSLDGTPPNPE